MPPIHEMIIPLISLFSSWLFLYFFTCGDFVLNISTLCLMPLKDKTFELVKFATKEGYYNLGAGKTLHEYALNDAKKFAKRITSPTITPSPSPRATRPYNQAGISFFSFFFGNE